MRTFPLTKTQLSIYIECISRKGEPAYIIPAMAQINNDISLADLAAVIDRVLANHSVSRLRITKGGDGMPCQYFVDKPITSTIEKLTDEEFRSQMQRGCVPMDIEDVPLAWVHLIDTPTEGKWLFMQWHHIVFDGFSFRLLADSIKAALNGEQLEPEKKTIEDIVNQETSERQSPIYEEAKAWYLEEFGGIDCDCVPLPDIDSHDAEKMVGDGSSRRMRAQELFLDVPYEEVFNASRRLDVPMSVLLEGAFGYMIALFTGNDESAFATIYHGRKDKAFNNTISMMVKTLPVYCHWQSDTTVSDYLLCLKEQTSAAKKYDVFSFADVYEHLKITDKLLFAYRGSINGDMFNVFGRTKNIKYINCSEGSTYFTVDHINGKLRFTAEYASDKYSETYMKQLSMSFDHVLGQMIATDKLSDITLASDSKVAEAEVFNVNELAYDDTLSLVDMLRSQARKTPDHIAVVAGERRLTYRELDALTDNIAAYLHSKGVGRGDVVAVIIHRNEFMAVASIGVSKAGAAYQPLDPTYPTERLNFMVNDSSAQFLIADEDLRPLLNGYNGDTLLTKDIESLPVAAAEEVAAYEPKPDDAFILLYTSGSTGVPKGCVLAHSNLVAFVNALQDTTCRFDEKSRVPAFASYGFDASMVDLYPGLTQGSTIYIIGDKIRLDFIALNKYFTDEGITQAFMTTQLGRAYALMDNVAPTLHHLMTGGEKLAPLTPPTAFELHNIYGPTETTVFVTGTIVNREYDRIPIGTALKNVHLYVVDKNLHRLPIGGVGELWISGPQVSRGYLNRPEKTAEVFISNPFSSDKKYSRIYRTGDIVRQLPNGMIDFIGRRDGLVKIRGFRIELSEIECVIRDFPSVKDATVQAFDDPSGGKFVAAYVVGDNTIDVQALNAFILERKPPYMVPAVTIQIDSIPLNQNHKVNKRALPKPERKAKEKKDFTPRKTNFLETALQELVGDIVGNKEMIDLTTPLSFLGLTSISSIRLSVAIYKRFGLELKSKELLGETTIESIENRILQHYLESPNDSSQGEEQDSPTKPKEQVAALTISQQGVYADCMRNPDTTTYNIPIAYRFPVTQNASLLAENMEKVMAAHPYMQMCLTTEDGDVKQRMTDTKPSVAVKEMSEVEYKDYSHRFVEPIDLMRSPLYHIEVVKTECAVYLLINIHHIVADGSSLSILIGQLKTLLESGSISAEQHNYFDYAKAEAEADEQEGGRYFATMLADCDSSSDIAADVTLKADGSWGESRKYSTPIDYDRIAAFCRTNNITPAALMLTAAGYAVARFTNSRHAYLCTVSTGRNDVRFADTVGMFVKTLPVHVNIDNVSAVCMAKATASMLTDTVAHEMYPFVKIVHDFNYAPNIMFEYQLGINEDICIGGNAVSHEILGVDTLKFKLAIRVENNEGKPSVVLYYKDGLYSEKLMTSLAASIVNVANAIMAAPDANARHISMIDAAEENVLRGFARTCPDEEVSIKLFHKMFERQVDLYPDKEILVSADGRFTYRQMEERANKVANALLTKGMKKGDSAVVLLHRTSAYFATVFGISKAGGVFIPTNPDYPQERINSIIGDSGAKFVITDEPVCDDCSRPNVDISPDDLVYMIYTSGSTGKPKGVELRHEGICNYLTDHPANPQIRYPLAEGSCYCSVTTVAFDMSFKEWAATLCNGMKLVFASDKETMDPRLLAEKMKKEGVDIINATPSRLLQYMEVDEFAEAIAKCKVILCGGEPYPQKLLNLLRSNTTARLLNTYGPTEITVSSNGRDLTHAKQVSVGRPLLNYEEYIVDADDNLLPVAAIGELVICGKGVARGYHNLPELTAEAFAEYKGKRAYRSGDYGCWTDDGEVVILGRKDSQVKLRGLRIELGEIENVLTAIDSVKSGIVLIRKIGNQDGLVAYYTLSSNSMLTADDIKAAMAQKLTNYMVPQALVQLDSMPLTPNGKINTRALPEPRVEERTAGREPATEEERFFANIFAKVLEQDKVYADDNFFELGGTSLTVIRVTIAAAKAGYRLVYADVFDNATPEALARLVEQRDVPVATSHEKVMGSKDAEETREQMPLKSPLNPPLNAIKFLASPSNSTTHATRMMGREPLGKVLLTGSTGYAGIHVLHELLTGYDVDVVCLVRSSIGSTPRQRLDSLYFYYFERTISEAYDSRVAVVDGDITKPETFCAISGVATVINCAANVKHFSNGTDIEDINYRGVLNLIDYCRMTGARLVQTSTISVAGRLPVGDNRVLTEQDLFIGQDFGGNKYVMSKFNAERAVIEATDKGEIEGKVVRLGNLAPRNTDGEFQINFRSNGFMNRLKAYYLIGCFPYSLFNVRKDVSPIDCVARAIVLFAQTPKECRLFHGNNFFRVSLGEFLAEAGEQGIPMRMVEDDEFHAALEEAKKNPKAFNALVGLLAYENFSVDTHLADYDNTFSMQVLLRMGFRWPTISCEYIHKFVRGLAELGFFDEI